MWATQTSLRPAAVVRGIIHVMNGPGDGEVTRLLRRWRDGDSDAEARLFELVLPDLRRLARSFMRRERPGHTLAATALLNEAYLRLSRARGHDWQDRRHFFAVAARAMRHYLIDYARAHPKAQFMPVEAAELLPAGRGGRIETALAIDGVLADLERESAEACAVVEAKFFLGLTDEETADALRLPRRTVQRRWQHAREFLYRRLGSPP